MPKRRADADSRRFLDEFESVRVSRFRATGVIDPAKRNALIPFPNGRIKLIGTAHTHLKYGGGFSYFICPKCARLTTKLFLIDDAPLCWQCCYALNIVHRIRYGFGRDERRRVCDQKLDELIAKVESPTSLRFKGSFACWHGKAQRLSNSRRLTKNLRSRMITLRLSQLASQHATDDGNLKLTRAYKPRADALAVIPEIKSIWRANSTKRLQQALDKAQDAILNALHDKDPQKRIIAAKLFARSKQGRERGFIANQT